MSVPTSLADATTFTAIGLVLALIAMWVARPLRRTMVVLMVSMLAGLAAIAALERFSGGIADTPLTVTWNELALVVVAVSVTRVTLMLVFQGLLARARLPRILAEVLLVLALIGYALYRMRAGGVNLAGIVTTSAIITGVIAFSLQETLGNLWGGIALQLDNTCRLGDWIRVEGITGQIVGIRWRCLAVATNDGETVVIPNAQLVKNKVIVLARRGDERTALRRKVSFSVSYAATPPAVVAIVADAFARAEIPNVRRAPAPFCVTEALDENGIRYALVYWLTDLALDVITDSRVLMKVFAALGREGMEVPLPQRVVHTRSDIAADREALAAQQIVARSEALADVDLFSAFTMEERRALAASLTDAAYTQGEIISREGDPSDMLFVLARGHVSVVSGGDAPPAQRKRLAELNAPSYFGEMGLLTGTGRMATIIAQDDVLCYRLPRSAFNTILKARPALAEALSQTIAARQAQNDATLQALDAEGRAKRSSGTAAELVRRIRAFFDLA